MERKINPLCAIKPEKAKLLGTLEMEEISEPLTAAKIAPSEFVCHLILLLIFPFMTLNLPCYMILYHSRCMVLYCPVKWHYITPVTRNYLTRYTALYHSSYMTLYLPRCLPLYHSRYLE